jgi:hypothetical protein
VLLNERCYDGEENHNDNDKGSAQVSQEIGDRRQRKEQGVERVFGSAPNFLQDRGLSLARDEIEPTTF